MSNEALVDIKRRLLVHEASRWVGVREQGGDNKGQFVEMFQKAVDGKAQGEPWCLAFVQFCISQVDSLYDDMLLSSHVQSKLIKTEHCLTLWNASKQFIDKPVAGNIVVWQFWKDGKPTTNGHVGIIKMIQDNKNMVTIEGNTSDGVGIVREGNGVYERIRSLNGSDSMKVLGCLKVW